MTWWRNLDSFDKSLIKTIILILLFLYGIASIAFFSMHLDLDDYTCNQGQRESWVLECAKYSSINNCTVRSIELFCEKKLL